MGYDPASAAKAIADQQARNAATDAMVAQVTAQEKMSKQQEAKQEADEKASTQSVPKVIMHLRGKVESSVPSGYMVYSIPEPIPPRGYQGVLPEFSSPLIGYDLDIVLKSNKVHTVGEILAIPVVDAGTYRDDGGNYYKAYSELSGN